MRYLLCALAVLSAVQATAALAAPPQTFTIGSLAAIRAAAHGTPTIVHFWGLTCAPCRTDMPDWATLLKAHPEVTFITVDTDTVPDPREKADQLWRDAGVTRRDAWRVDDTAPEALFFDIDHKWQGEVPMTVLIARDGRTESFVGAIDRAKIDRWLTIQGRP